ncbi:MAG: MFS transporter [Pseudomonadota bacterium]
MFEGLKSLWPLLLGVWLIIFGSALQNTLIGYRASLEGFTYTYIGIIFTANYVGFFIGSIIAPRMVVKAGHVRVFAAMTATASAISLLQAVVINPEFWALSQFVVGLCFATMYVVAESWLNDAADNMYRGQIMSSYMLVVLVGKMAGYYLFSVASPQSFILFSYVSILISLSVVPMLLSAGRSPIIEIQERVSVIAIFKISSSAFVVVLASQIFVGMFNSLGPVYAHELGLDSLNVSHFMALFVLGGLILQWPIGAFSDKIDRRKVIIVASLISLLTCFLAIFINHFWVVLLCVFLLGAFAHPLYSLGIAHSNDFLSPSQRVSASATLILLASIGSAIGPMMGSSSMDYIGSNGLFVAASIPFIIIIMWLAWRISQRSAVPEDMRSDIVHIPTKATPTAAQFNVETTDLDETSQTQNSAIAPIADSPSYPSH